MGKATCITVIVAVAAVMAAAGADAAAGQLSGVSARNAMTPPDRPAGGKPYLASFNIEDSCQFRICGSEYVEEFGGRDPLPGSCSGECNDLAHRLAAHSNFKKDFMWAKCASMCAEKYSQSEYKTYNERLTCMDECFDAYEKINPHYRVAQACVHAACSAARRQATGQSAIECFSKCTHHVGTRVPQDDWKEYGNLLSVAKCEPPPTPAAHGGHQAVVVIPAAHRHLRTDALECADQHLWDKMTAQTSVSPDVHLLCLNAMCDNDVRCGKACLRHVTKDVAPQDLAKWGQCTYSTGCAGIHAYAERESCADGCLEMHKMEISRAEQMAREERDSKRKKEAEALMAGSSAFRGAFTLVAMSIAMVLTLA